MSLTEREKEKDLEMINRMMETGTADSFMSLTDEQKRMAFAVGVHESTLRKQLNEECSELVEALELAHGHMQLYLGHYNDVRHNVYLVVTKALANHAKRMRSSTDSRGEE